MNINEDLIFTSFILRNNQSTAVEYDSKNWNLYRVSGNDRYTETLTPTFEDKIVHVPGQKGSYYFGTKYKDKPLSINVAFDNLTIAKFNQMISVFKNLVMQDEPTPLQLIFDDTPYKMNLVYLQNPPIFSYVPFDEDGETVLKGEGTINFICFEPFARSTEYRYIKSYNGGYILQNKEHFKKDGDYNGIITPFNSRLIQFNDGISIDNIIVNFGDYDLSPMIKIYKSAFSFRDNETSKTITILCSKNSCGVSPFTGEINNHSTILNYFKIDFPKSADYVVVDCANSQVYDSFFNNLKVMYDYDNYASQASCNIVIPSGYSTILQKCAKKPYNRSFLSNSYQQLNYDFVYGIYIEGVQDIEGAYSTSSPSPKIELIYDYLYM